jgi:cyclomaltodextrinase
MRRAASSPVWTAVVPLAPGRYRYAFLLDGSHWVADPAAPAARDDEFGAASSVLTVGGS